MESLGIQQGLQGDQELLVKEPGIDDQVERVSLQIDGQVAADDNLILVDAGNRHQVVHAAGNETAFDTMGELVVALSDVKAVEE